MDLTSIFDRICMSDMTIASQQRDEPDLTRDQKHSILNELYTTKPETFVYRFGSILTDEELETCFDKNSDYIQQLLKQNRRKTTHNRRYAYMQQLLSEGTYFSDEAMKERSPLLYEQLIKKYSHGVDLPLVTKTASGPLTDFYMEHLESMNHNTRVADEIQEEYKLRADTDDEDGDDDNEDEKDDEDYDEDEEEEEDEQKSYPNAEVNLYRNEFLSIHKEIFLNGEDPNIDYTSIDRNENLDNLKILEQDEEERYFNDDE